MVIDNLIDKTFKMNYFRFEPGKNRCQSKEVGTTEVTDKTETLNDEKYFDKTEENI